MKYIVYKAGKKRGYYHSWTVVAVDSRCILWNCFDKRKPTAQRIKTYIQTACDEKIFRYLQEISNNIKRIENVKVTRDDGTYEEVVE